MISVNEKIKTEIDKIESKILPACYSELIKKCLDDDEDKRPSFNEIVKELIEKKKKFISMMFLLI